MHQLPQAEFLGRAEMGRFGPDLRLLPRRFSPRRIGRQMRGLPQHRGMEAGHQDARAAQDRHDRRARRIAVRAVPQQGTAAGAADLVRRLPRAETWRYQGAVRDLPQHQGGLEVGQLRARLLHLHPAGQAPDRAVPVVPSAVQVQADAVRLCRLPHQRSQARGAGGVLAVPLGAVVETEDVRSQPLVGRFPNRRKTRRGGLRELP